jgi:hypothetical protein
LTGALLLAFILSHVLASLAPQAFLLFSDHDHDVQLAGEHGHFDYVLRHSERDPSVPGGHMWRGQSGEGDADHLIHLDNSGISYLASAKTPFASSAPRSTQAPSLSAFPSSAQSASLACVESHPPQHLGPQARSVVLRV